MDRVISKLICFSAVQGAERERLWNVSAVQDTDRPSDWA